MRLIPRECWPDRSPPDLVAAWRDLDYMAQLYEASNGAQRLSVNRVSREGVHAVARWRDGITWDELMAVKSGCGFGGHWAVEIFPPDQQVVDVANMRHLWLLPEAPAFAWKVTVPAWKLTL